MNFQFKSGLATLALLVLTLVGSYQLTGQGISESVKPIEIEKLPYELGEWVGQDLAEMTARNRSILKLDSYIKRFYRNPAGQGIYVYIGYWKKQSGEHQAAKHSPVTCLPSNGWSIYNPEKNIVEVETKPFKVNQLTGSIKSKSSLFYYWFFNGQETYLEEWKALIKIGMGNLIHGRSDGGIVEISTAFEQANGRILKPNEVQEVLNNFMQSFKPELEKLMHNT